MGRYAGLHGPADALPQMKSVDHLDCGGGADSSALRVGARSVSTNDLHAWVIGQPHGRRSGVAGREHVDHSMGFAAGQDGGIGLSTADREVVHAQHAGRAGLRVGQRHDLAQQGRPSCAKAELSGQPGTGPSSEGKPNAFQGMAESRGEACVRGGQPRERFGECATWTVCRVADETPDGQTDHNALPSERQVLQSALVGAVHPVR